MNIKHQSNNVRPHFKPVISHHFRDEYQCDSAVNSLLAVQMQTPYYIINHDNQYLYCIYAAAIYLRPSHRFDAESREELLDQVTKNLTKELDLRVHQNRDREVKS